MTTKTAPAARRTALPYVAMLFSAAALVSARADAVPVSAQDILNANPAATDGIYTIDPDGQGGIAAFDAYADMSSFGGGWTLGLNSLRNDVAATSDMTSNTGTVGLNTSHTRNLTNLAILGDAQIRHQIIDNNQVVFDGYYTGNYHGVLSETQSDWTIAVGDLWQTFGSHSLGEDWSSVDNDIDDTISNCAATYGPWYHGSCWTSHPASTSHSGPYANSHSFVDSWRIWVRGVDHGTQATTAVPEPATLALMLAGLAGLGFRRR